MFEEYYKTHYKMSKSGHIIALKTGYTFPLSVTKSHIRRTWYLRRPIKLI